LIEIAASCCETAHLFLLLKVQVEPLQRFARAKTPDEDRVFTLLNATLLMIRLSALK
jgi:hypothetical protein